MSSAATGGAIVSGGRCSTCDVELAGPFCHQCGEAHPHEGDLALRHLLHDAVHDLTHLDGKIWRTIRALLVEPGRLTKEYWEGRRSTRRSSSKSSTPTNGRSTRRSRSLPAS